MGDDLKRVEKVIFSLKNIKSSLIEEIIEVGKKIAKADKKISGVGPQDDPETLRKRLRKARRKLEKEH